MKAHVSLSPSEPLQRELGFKKKRKMKPVPLAGTHRLYKSNMHGKLKKTRKGLRRGNEGVRGREESRKTVKNLWFDDYSFNSKHH